MSQKKEDSTSTSSSKARFYMIERLGKIDDTESIDSNDLNKKRTDDDDDDEAEYKLNEKLMTNRAIQTNFLNKSPSSESSISSLCPLSLNSSRLSSSKNNKK
jgi:hypothetical protein